MPARHPGAPRRRERRAAGLAAEGGGGEDAAEGAGGEGRGEGRPEVCLLQPGLPSLPPTDSLPSGAMLVGGRVIQYEGLRFGHNSLVRSPSQTRRALVFFVTPRLPLPPTLPWHQIGTTSVFLFTAELPFCRVALIGDTSGVVLQLDYSKAVSVSFLVECDARGGNAGAPCFLTDRIGPLSLGLSPHLCPTSSPLSRLFSYKCGFFFWGTPPSVQPLRTSRSKRREVLLWQQLPASRLRELLGSEGGAAEARIRGAASASEDPAPGIGRPKYRSHPGLNFSWGPFHGHHLGGDSCPPTPFSGSPLKFIATCGIRNHEPATCRVFSDISSTGSKHHTFWTLWKGRL